VGLVVLVAGVGGAALGWAGFGEIAARFSQSGEVGLDARWMAWRDTLAIVRDFPLTGTGLNSFADAMTTYETPGLSAHFFAAHNDYLQLASEGGLLVGIPASLLFGSLVFQVAARLRQPHASQTTYWVRVGAASGLLAIAVQSLFDFSLQTPGNAVLCAVLCGIVVHRAPHARRYGGSFVSHEAPRPAA
jgi:O-antigen ligase